MVVLGLYKRVEHVLRNLLMHISLIIFRICHIFMYLNIIFSICFKIILLIVERIC